MIHEYMHIAENMLQSLSIKSHPSITLEHSVFQDNLYQSLICISTQVVLLQSADSQLFLDQFAFAI
uniref:Uncharacterized protein n=1 Tax=Rhizophora mucronata TaxID=61149 RepID=A0A2P2L026_RHIMU